MSDVTQILKQIEAGDSMAAIRLMPLVYDELRKLAAALRIRPELLALLRHAALVIKPDLEKEA
jgi:hypothetical protein